MKVADNSPVQLAYCLNVHPGESWEENFSAIRDKALAVRKLVCPERLFALGLRLGNEAAASLMKPAVLEEFSGFMVDNGLYVFTVNGFPYGSFHGARVKEDVYRPDWRDRRRLDYTVRLADVLGVLLPPGLQGSISTVPGSYGTWIRADADVQTMVRNLAECAWHLAEIREEHGKLICLALEPEPDCFLENTGGTIAFFEDRIFRVGVDFLAAEKGIARQSAEEVLRRHLGVCFDTCHIALQFEDLAESLGRLAGCGISVPKVQVSSAIRAVTGAGLPADLLPFVDPVYLHQVKVRAGSGALRSFPDLSAGLLEELVSPGGQELRAHFHVPLYFEGEGGFGSTSGLLVPEFFRACAKVCSHIEIETYTYNVLPERLRARDVVYSIADEYGWVLERVCTGEAEERKQRR